MVKKATATVLSPRPVTKKAPVKKVAAPAPAKVVNPNPYECPVCNIMRPEPVKAPCKHDMCFKCREDIITGKLICPICEEHFDKL